MADKHDKHDERDEHVSEGTGKQGPWAEPDEEHRADKQQGDVHALDVEGDPRGGVQSDAYRHAEPTELVEDENVSMMGPGGAPQDGLSAEERRKLNRPDAA